jgi:DNA-binding transcriptional LysR family regulator
LGVALSTVLGRSSFAPCLHGLDASPKPLGRPPRPIEQLAEAYEIEARAVESLSDETFILPQFENTGSFTDYAIDFLSAVQPTPKDIYPVRDFLTAVSLVGAGFGVALVTESVRSLTMANVVYGEIVDYKRVYDIALAYRTAESAPAVRAFIETCKGLRA